MVSSGRNCAMSVDAHDFVDLHISISPDQSAKIGALYKKGLSLRDIKSREGLSKAKIRTILVRSEIPLRPKFEEGRVATQGTPGKRSAKPPYGFCYFEGRVTRHPKEWVEDLSVTRI